MSDSFESGTTHVEVECTECPWRFFRHQADELAGLSGERMADVIDREAKNHTRATGHEVTQE